MVDLHERFRSLVDLPLADPEPMPRLQRRARAVRRRRRARQAGTLAVVLLGVLGMTSLVVGDGGLGPIRSPRVVLDQPGSDERLPPVPDGWQTHDEDGIAFHYPAGWSVVADPEGPQVIVGTQRVDERDAHLALLTHPDVVFTQDFPAEGVFFAVGGDRFRAPRDQFSEEVTVGFKANAEGAEIRARFGRVPVSVYQVAAYAGPEATAEDWSLVEQMAETVIERQPRTGDIPPPPPGPPGFPEGKDQPVAAATNEVLRLPLSLPGMDSEVVVLTGDGCAVVSLDEPTDTGGPRPQAGRCQSDAHTPAADQVDAETLIAGDVLGPPVETPSGQVSEQPAEQPPDSVGQAEGARPPPASEPARRPPGSDQPADAPPPGLMDDTTSAMFVATQVGERVERVESRLVDGRLADGEVSDGWALVVTESRIAWLTAYDADGDELDTVFVR